MKSDILFFRIWLHILVISSRTSTLDAAITCPTSLLFEEGSDATLKCNITDRHVFAVYWYRGTFPRDHPLVQLENFKPGGVEYGNGHFDITKEGAMVIKSVKLEDEGYYNIYVAKEKLKFLGKKVELKITGICSNELLPPWKLASSFFISQLSNILTNQPKLVLLAILIVIFSTFGRYKNIKDSKTYEVVEKNPPGRGQSGSSSTRKKATKLSSRKKRKR